MKKKLTIIAATILIFYLMTAFTVWDLNVANWDAPTRAIVSCFAVILGFLFAIKEDFLK